MKSKIVTALSVVGVMSAGAAAAVVNTNTLQGKALETVGDATAQLATEQQPLAPLVVVTHSATPKPTQSHVRAQPSGQAKTGQKPITSGSGSGAGVSAVGNSTATIQENSTSRNQPIESHQSSHGSSGGSQVSGTSSGGSSYAESDESEDREYEHDDHDEAESESYEHEYEDD